MDQLRKEKIKLLLITNAVSFYYFYLFYRPEVIRSKLDLICFLVTFSIPYFCGLIFLKHIKKEYEGNVTVRVNKPVTIKINSTGAGESESRS